MFHDEKLGSCPSILSAKEIYIKRTRVIHTSFIILISIQLLVEVVMSLKNVGASGR